MDGQWWGERHTKRGEGYVGVNLGFREVRERLEAISLDRDKQIELGFQEEREIVVVKQRYQLGFSGLEREIYWELQNVCVCEREIDLGIGIRGLGRY